MSSIRILLAYERAVYCVARSLVALGISARGLDAAQAPQPLT